MSLAAAERGLCSRLLRRLCVRLLELLQTSLPGRDGEAARGKGVEERDEERRDEDMTSYLKRSAKEACWADEEEKE
jgi:hypothetical protein